MFLRRVACAAAILCLGISACVSADALMGRYDPTQSGYTPDKLPLPLALDWEFTAGKFDNNPAAPVVSGGTCYFASGDLVYAVDLETGTPKWQYPGAPTRLSGTVKATPVLDGGNLYFGATDMNLYCLDAATGQFKWLYPARGAIRCAPVLADGVLYFGADDNSLYGIQAQTGDAAWKPFTARDDFATGIAVGSGMVIASSMDGNVYGVNSSTGQLRTQPFRMSQAPVHSSPIIVQNTAVMAVGNTMYGLSIRGNQLRWMVTLPSDVAATPAARDYDVFVPCRDKKIYAYNVSGRQPVLKWTEPADLGAIPMSSPTIADETLFVTGSKGVVAAFSTIDGSLKWRYMVAPSSVNTPGQAYTDASASPVVADGRLLVVTDDGVLHCFRPDACDSVPPSPYNMVPQSGALMSGLPPIKMSCMLYDIGSGVDFDTVGMSLDGQPVDDCKVDRDTFSVSYVTAIGDQNKPLKKLDDGAHTVTVTARDYKGNLLKHEWFFIVDNSLPAPKRPMKPEEQKKKTKEPTRPTYSPPSQPSKDSTSSAGAPPPPPPVPSAPGDYPSERSHHRHF